MLKLSSGSCMLRLGLRLSIGSCMLRLGLRLRLRLSFRGSGGQPLPLKLSLSPSLSMHDPMLSLSPSLSMHELSLSMPEPMLSLSMLILATYPSSNSPSWPATCPGMFGTSFGTFGTSGTFARPAVS